jgi:hypothetical protein
MTGRIKCATRKASLSLWSASPLAGESESGATARRDPSAATTCRMSPVAMRCVSWANIGWHCMSDAVRALGDLVDALPAMVIDTLREQLRRTDALAQ